ncbi:PAS domain S-box protein [Anaerobacillus sp. HL2]|nr:PAS domain S-box protein [Anaerobacillus sp. HL2]
MNKGTWTGELINKKKNGEYYWSYITITQIKKKNSNTYYIGIIRDITSRKLAEEQISYLAFHDNLTDLANRSSFKQMVTEHINKYDEGKK